MNVRPLEGFRALKTHHCITGALRHVYEFHGCPVSEELLLGLGEGIGFVYWHMKGLLPLLGGRANVGRPGEDGLERASGRRLGVAVERFDKGSAARAERALLELLAAGRPVPIYADMGYLPYLGLPEGTHFGGHMAVVAGADPTSRMALVADRDGVLPPISLEMLAQARGSKFRPFPPNNAWYTLDFAGFHPPAPEAVRQAIRAAAEGMLNAPIANLGVKGIRTAAERVRRWPKLLGDEETRKACIQAALFIDARGGTGGGIFRLMYGRFLAEAAEITGDGRLSDAGREMQAIGARWDEAAALFAACEAADDPSAPLDEASAILGEVAERERGLWEALGKALG